MCRGEVIEAKDEGSRKVPTINGVPIRRRDREGTGNEENGRRNPVWGSPEDVMREVEGEWR